jgi:ATP-dependent helicase HrpB
LWDEHEDASLSPRTRPEILEADLSSLALELADNGILDARELRWLDLPPQGAMDSARELLQQLGALDTDGRVTAHGKRMAELPLAPRLSHMLLAGDVEGNGELAAIVAALIEERDIVTGERGIVPADLAHRVELILRSAAAPGLGDGNAMVQHDAVNRVRENARELRKRLSSSSQGSTRGIDLHEVGALVARAYPDRVAQRREGTAARFLMRNGTGALLAAHDALSTSAYLAVAELDGVAPEFRIVRAAAITLEEIRDLFADQIHTLETVEWDEDARAVRAWRRLQLGALVLEESRDARPHADLVRDATIGMMKRIGVDAWPWTERARRLRERLAFVAMHDSTWPSMSSNDLLQSIEEWSGDVLDGVKDWNDLSNVNWHDVLLSRLSWSQRAELETLAPTHVIVPTGSNLPIDYSDPSAPQLAVRLQELFGWSDTPRLMHGRVPLTLQLLSPANRPVQVTRDLAGFWKSSYFEVRKEMRGRYPRHPWPDDPLSAPPTRRAKPRGT